MNLRHHLYFLCLQFLLGFCLSLKAQTTNPCGVAAVIWPAASDSVVPVNSIIPLTDNSINAISIQWLYDGAFTGITSPVWNYTVTAGIHTISLVAFNGGCSDTITVVYFSAGTAHNLDSLFMAQYGTYMFNEEGTCIDKTPDSGFIAGGVQYPWNTCGQFGVLVKTRIKGCIDWSKKIVSPYNCTNSEIKGVAASADSGYYVVIGDYELARLDKNGIILWTRRLNLGNLGPISVPYIITDSQSDVYTVTGAFNNGWTVTKVDKNGNLQWNRLFRLSYNPGSGPGPTEFAIPSGMHLLNDKLYVCGNAYSNVNSSYFSFITRLDPVTGSREWQYGYTDPNFPTAVGFVQLSSYDTLLMATSGAQGQSVTLIDQQGQVRKSIKTQFSTSYGPKITRAGADRDGHIYMMQWVEQTLPLQPYFQYYSNFAEIDTSLNKYWGMVFSASSRPYFSDATMGLDDKFGAIGTNYGLVADGQYYSRDLRLLKVDTVNSEQFCFVNGNNYTIAAQVINRLDFQYMVDSSLGIIADPSIPYTTVDAFVQSRYTCPDYIDSCSFMKITGPVSLCSLSDTYTYRMHRNRKCTLSPQWQLPAGVTIINQTDSTLSVQFSTFGVYRIYASMYSCIPVKDSLIVNMVSGSGTLNIGADTSICPGSTITLQAANNFLSYLWNNGSTGSAITVTQPGTYWVETIDSCNNRLRDSIIIKAYDQLINIGPDRIKCNNDTLHLNAPGGFLNYTWSNNYNISSTTAQNVVVYPSVDTTYYLKAEKLPGCFAYDTVHISVNHSPLVNLGIDTSICIGTAIRFDAGPGFVQYQWNTGASTQQISVNNVGIFSVIATAQNGCKSFDTVRLVKINQLPVVSLNPDTTICYSDTRILDAGVGYVSYLWNTGSVQRSINVNGTGNFSVNVIDANGCKGSGSIYINTILPTPSGFLPPDTSICTYSKMVLKTAVPFNQYLWNDNSVASSITVSAPGLYWLQVMDNKNCKGKDTIIVMPKNCTRGLFVPGAFTPNGDFKNDLFKPTLFGTVQRYEFIVYNRYGETVFETKDIMKGWDGAYKGKQQNAGVYVWKCIYQVDSQMLTSEQGTIVLIR